MLPITVKLFDKVKIEGESLVTGYEKQIDLTLLQHAVDMPMLSDKSSNQRTSGRCKHEEFSCVSRMNKAYPKLIEACAKGSNLGTAEIYMLKMSEGKTSVVVKYVLTDVYVSSVAIEPDEKEQGANYVDSDSTFPLVRFNLNYQSFSATYNEYDKAGAAKGAVSCDPVTGLGS
jgi:type VI secretion system Hcp family effector